MRRNKIVVAVLGLSAAALAAFMVLRPTVEYRIPLADIQSRIDARMPVEGGRLGVSWSVSDVRLAFADGGRATLEAKVDVEGYGREVFFEAEGTAVPEYRDGAFWLTGIDLGDVRVLRLREKHGAIAAAGRMAAGLVERGIISEERVAGLRDEVVGAAEKALVERVESRPVHVLDTGTVKGSLAAATLRDLNVGPAGVLVTLDPFGFLARILLWTAVGVLAFGATLGMACGMLGTMGGRRTTGSIAAGGLDVPGGLL